MTLFFICSERHVYRLKVYCMGFANWEYIQKINKHWIDWLQQITLFWFIQWQKQQLKIVHNNISFVLNWRFDDFTLRRRIVDLEMATDDIRRKKNSTDSTRQGNRKEILSGCNKTKLNIGRLHDWWLVVQELQTNKPIRISFYFWLKAFSKECYQYFV